MQKYQYFEWGSTLNLDGFKIIIFQYIICEPFRSWKEGLVKFNVNQWEIWQNSNVAEAFPPPAAKMYVKAPSRMFVFRRRRRSYHMHMLSVWLVVALLVKSKKNKTKQKTKQNCIMIITAIRYCKVTQVLGQGCWNASNDIPTECWLCRMQNYIHCKTICLHTKSTVPLVLACVYVRFWQFQNVYRFLNHIKI